MTRPVAIASRAVTALAPDVHHPDTAALVHV